MPHTPARVPPELLHGSSRVLRPRDATGVYAHPRPEFARLERAGALHRLATGYYVPVPDDQLGRDWRPELEAVALGIAVADEGTASVALMGLSAARVHTAIPRGLAIAVVATSRHRPPLHLADRDAMVLFARRRVSSLDVQHHTGELGQGWITTIEQTTLDLVARPTLGGLPDQALNAAHALLARCDRDLLNELAVTQRRQASLSRLYSVA
ncbi:hypothetical protein [Sciscionella sediminilitoris]|uniref:hypothetical protein n=1 Tax=Sciscionella sediminilitoris TaxID=1445613 RepID=UPI0004DF95DF|nr:hypothetical protein [Sciscionella sp. SE31]